MCAEPVCFVEEATIACFSFQGCVGVVVYLYYQYIGPCDPPVAGFKKAYGFSVDDWDWQFL